MEPTIHNTIGALQIGSLLSIFLFGIITLQVNVYFQTYRKDKWLFKVMVPCIWVLELGHTICIAYEVYNATISNYGTSLHQVNRFQFLGASTAIGGTITLVVHNFFSARLWKILPHPYRYIGRLCSAVALVRFVGSIYQAVKAITAENVTQYREENSWLVATLLASGAAIDVCIASSMIWFLGRKRRQSMERGTILIDRLVNFTLRANLLTTLTAIGVLIAYLTVPRTLIWGSVYASLAKLYTNSLLSALNDRVALRDRMSRSISQPSPPKWQHQQTPNPLAISVQMQTSVQAENGEFGEEYKRYFASIVPDSPESPTSAHLSPTSAYHPTHSSRLVFHSTSDLQPPSPVSPGGRW